MLRLLRFAACLLFSSYATAACYQEAAERYGVPEPLLRAIAHVESGSADARTVENRNTNGTRDIGRMQINTGWLPTLRSFGISEDSLREECVSIHVGAWILANNMQQHGGLSWKAVGAYNVGCLKLSAQECERRRNSYSWRVYRALQKQGALAPSHPTVVAVPAAAPQPAGGSRIASVTLTP
jgi:soluble lytic murein transglycosylase-like protein